MAERKSYGEKLKDPRWQKRRLEILQAADWRCSRCADSEATLHVHHLYYLPKAQPWEYPDAALAALCESCHEESHALRQRISVAMAALEALGFSGIVALESLLGYAEGLLVGDSMARCYRTDGDHVTPAEWFVAYDIELGSARMRGFVDGFNEGIGPIWCTIVGEGEIEDLVSTEPGGGILVQGLLELLISRQGPP